MQRSYPAGQVLKLDVRKTGLFHKPSQLSLVLTNYLAKRPRVDVPGVLVATQSPGDLDYKCRDNIRTWFVGRVAQKTAIDKMKPLLSDCRVNVSSRLPNAQIGFTDRNGGGNGSWNSSHGTRGCSQAALVRTHGIGMLYCFAVD